MDTGLIAHIKKFVTLSVSEEAVVHDHIKMLQVKKKGYVLKEGHVCTASYFIEKGCLRLFFVDEKGIEQTTLFAIENWWMADYSSFCHGAAATFSIQAIEPSTVAVLDKSSRQHLFARVPQIESYFRQLLEIAAGAAQWRVRYIYSLSKEDMYKQFIASYPGFVQRVPQYMLASFLGLTPEYLSEIRKKKS